MCYIDLLGVLQEHTFSAIIYASAQMDIAANKNLDHSFHIFLTIIKSDIVNIENLYQPSSKRCFCLLLFLGE